MEEENKIAKLRETVRSQYKAIRGIACMTDNPYTEGKMVMLEWFLDEIDKITLKKKG